MHVLQKGIVFGMQKIHHKTLKVISQPNKTYEELLELSETASIHQQHFRFLVIEVCKSTSYLNPKFMYSFFTHKEIPEEGRVKCFHCLLQDRPIMELTQCTSRDP